MNTVSFFQFYFQREIFSVKLTDMSYHIYFI